MIIHSDMATLRELTTERLALKNKLEVLDFDQETILDTLEAGSAELEAKIQDYGFVILEMDSFADAIKAERDRLDKRLKIAESRVGHIKEWLKTNMTACGITKIECPVFTVALQNNPPSVVIDAESQIPADYMRQPEPPPAVPDKTLIKKAISDGYDVPGAHLIQTQRLVIK